MKFKVTQLIEELPTWSPDPNPKNIVMYAWACDGEIDGRPVHNVELKTGSQETFRSIAVGSEFLVEDKSAGQYTTYKILPKSQQAGGSGRGFRQSGSSGGSGGHKAHDSFGQSVGNALTNAVNFVVGQMAHNKKMAEAGWEDVCIIADRFLHWSKKQQGVVDEAPAAEKKDELAEVGMPPLKAPPKNPELTEREKKIVDLMARAEKHDLSQQDLEAVIGVKVEGWQEDELKMVDWNLKRVESGKIKAAALKGRHD